MTKRSTANANTEKASRQQCRSGISTSPTPCCESLRQQHPNNSKQHGALAKTGDMQAGLETFNQQPCSPESCHSVTLAKVLLFGKAAPFFAKKGHCSNLIFGAVNTYIGFLDSKKWSSPVALKACCLNKTQLCFTCVMYLKSFVFRAGRKVPHCQKWDCHALPLFALDRAISRLFSFLF